ncbi:hypothetical protein JK364_53600 [Streptomyces sp. 110]|uniref:Uncharacterized protein n=1 Tax=Streptomyces endocoffeicus TaxID=2898945 RepID=A0ABS1Q8L1_9ACTN|nr:hypothetical protein [Streptomyces endocoffeicus]MBL1121009.1 hypothetical protein [Streptomyces endocoffeicus]
MALCAHVERIYEDEKVVRYQYENSTGERRTLFLDKTTEQLSPESGAEDTLYRAIAMKLASLWVRDGAPPTHFIVQP